MFRKSVLVVAVLAVTLVLLQVPSSYGRYGPGGGRGRVIIRVVSDHPWGENAVTTSSLSASGGNNSETIQIHFAGFPWGFGFSFWIIRTQTDNAGPQEPSTVMVQKGISDGLKQTEPSFYGKRRPR